MGKAVFVKRLEVPPNFSQVRAARRFVRNALAGTPPGIVDDMQLVVSELVSNAIEHGAREGVGVELQVTRNDVLLTVESHGHVGHLPRVEKWVLAPATEPSGRGLGIVRGLSDSVHVTREADSVTVAVHRRFALG